MVDRCPEAKSRCWAALGAWYHLFLRTVKIIHLQPSCHGQGETFHYQPGLVGEGLELGDSLGPFQPSPFYDPLISPS